MDKKKLTKSSYDRKICGVCGGVGQFLGVDPTIIRLLWVIALFMGWGVIAYIACAFIIPEEPYYDTYNDGQNRQ